MKPALLLVVLAMGCVGLDVGITDNSTIGGQTVNGCLVAAGYSWNETVGACLREWELNGLDKVAAKKAAATVNGTATILEVDSGRCIGCFLVRLKTDKERTVILENWEVSETKDICTLDDECVPVPMCHPRQCITSYFAENFEQMDECTEVFFDDAAYTAEDCVCMQNKCINKNIT
jgi:hypothetical protein